MSVRSRVAFASGAGAAVGSLLLLSGRYEGSVVLLVLAVVAVRTAGLGTLVGGGPILAADGVRALRGRALLAPSWALAAAAAVARAGSTAVVDVRGVNAVVGPGLFYGPALTVAGTWLACAAAVLAIVARPQIGVETGGGAGIAGRVVMPAAVGRLDVLGVIAEAALVVSLFLGPQIVDAPDATWWVAGIAVVLGIAWLSRRIRPPLPYTIPALAAAAGVTGLALVLLGGRP